MPKQFPVSAETSLQVKIGDNGAMETAAAEGGCPMPKNQPVIDFSEALMRTLGDVDFLKSMLLEFQSIAPNCLERIENALQSRNVEALAREAHQFKGSAANLGIKVVASIALDLERVGKTSDYKSGMQALQELKKAIAQFNTFLDATDFSTLSSD